jgi:hypothetical protein
MYFNNQSMLCDAIKKHCVVRFCYKGEFSYREVEPYAVFYSAENNVLLHGFQLKDESSPLKAPGARNFDLDEINRLELTPAVFKPDINFSINHLKICKRGICTINTL